MSNIKELLKSDDTVNELLRSVKPTFFPTLSKVPGSWQIDIMFLDNYKGVNGGFSCLLNCVEITSRFACSYPMKNKSATQVLAALKKFIGGNKVARIFSDKGKEFENRNVQGYAAKHGIQWIFANPQDQRSNTKVERWNQTLRNLLTRLTMVTGSRRYVDRLGEIVDYYNAQEHSATGVPPKDVKTEEDYRRITIRAMLSKQYREAFKRFQQFHIGDTVRLLQHRPMFAKGRRNFSLQVYKIVDVLGHRFILENSQGQRLKYPIPHYELLHAQSEAPVKEEVPEEVEDIKARKTVKRINRNAKITVTPEEVKETLADPTSVAERVKVNRRERKANPKYIG